MRPNYQQMPQELNQVNLPMQTGYGAPGSFSAWLTSPQISQGLMGAGQAILAPNSGYGGNIANGLGGFNQGMQEQKQREIESAIKANNTYAALGRASRGGNSPAALQMVNAWKEAKESGDEETARKIELFAKVYDKGVIGNGAGGVQEIGNYGNAKAGIEGQVSAAKQNAQNRSDLAYKPLIEGDKKSAEILSENQANAQVNLPTAENNAKFLVDAVTALKNHPGKSDVVGAKNIFSGAAPTVIGLPPVAGSDAADFKSRLDQVKGQQFLQAFESLKGGGSITEAEGKKATDAVARMQTSTSETEFDKAADEFVKTVGNKLDLTKIRANPPRTSGIGRIGGAPKVQKSQLLPPANPQNQQQRKPLGDIFK